jgi:hypothetical protein
MEEGEPHPLQELELLRAYDAFKRIQRVIRSHRLPPSRRLNNPRAVEDEIYAVGERATGMLHWGWKLLPELGVLVSLVYEYGHSTVFVMFRQSPESDRRGRADFGSWSIEFMPGDPRQLVPSIRTVWTQLKLPDPEHIDDLTVMDTANLIVQTFKSQHADLGEIS